MDFQILVFLPSVLNTSAKCSSKIHMAKWGSMEWQKNGEYLYFENGENAEFLPIPLTIDLSKEGDYGFLTTTSNSLLGSCPSSISLMLINS